MESNYEPSGIEQLAQQYWDEQQTFKAIEDPQREKFYCLAMFPYPSGKLHMGHVRNYTIGDVIARHQRMLGKNVLQPMGWDAFGLPAENAAIKNDRPPAEWTYANIDEMRSQLQLLGFGYDWDRELATCDPDYYQWEQWFFTRLMKKGLAYKKCATVNWDPVDHTVLANEQVIDGKGWRSGAKVEKRDIEQWFIRITDYAQELHDSIDQLDGWPDAVRTMQRNWIGRSRGVEMEFGLEGCDETLSIYTTRPDTLMGVTYVAVAAEHPLARKAAAGNPALTAFIEECKQGGVSEAEVETMEKKGMALGINALHPVTGEAIPLYTANFVLMSYGSGAVMAVPAHDQRDWEFAHKYGINIKQVIFPADNSDCGVEACAYVKKGILKDSGVFNNLTSAEAFDAVADWLQQHDKGGTKTNFRLRDWGVSRQRYWGCPIPVVNRDSGETIAAGEFPVRLPEDVHVDGTGSPLKKMPQFYDLGNGDRRETDTFDTFVESSWYFARYCSYDNKNAMLDERANYWLPVDQYIGGIEHAVLHLLYARFFNKLMRDEGLLQHDEPFTNLLTQGMVIAETYYRSNEDGSKVWFNPADVQSEDGTFILKSDGEPVIFGGIEKMSKSKNNGVDPQHLIDRYGADTVRLYTMFTAPPDQSLEWSDEGVEGAYRFLRRLWALAHKHADSIRTSGEKETHSEASADIRRDLHTVLKKALFDYERQQFNTVVSACMTLVNSLYKTEDAAVLREGIGMVLQLLAPIAPHMSHYLWRELNYGDDILTAGWPQVDEEALIQQQIEYVAQVNGKVRSKILVPADADQAAIETLALQNENVKKFIGDAQIRKIIVVPGRLVNIVAPG
ncbi:MAG: leucine--tRNA ligase [Pseudomonadota bacterium]|nr:leucine--tRNA ligase [Pseudomonadota bacterium]